MKIELKQRLIGGVVVVVAAITLLPFFILHRSHSRNSVNLAENQQVLQIKDSSSDNNNSDDDWDTGHSGANANVNTGSYFPNTVANNNDNMSDNPSDLNHNDQQTNSQSLADNGAAASMTTAANGPSTSSEVANPIQPGTDDIASSNVQINSPASTVGNTNSGTTTSDVSNVNNTQTANNTSTVVAEGTSPPDNSAFITASNQTITTDSSALSALPNSNTIHSDRAVNRSQNETTVKSSTNSVTAMSVHKPVIASSNVTVVQSSPKPAYSTRPAYAAPTQNRYVAPSVPSVVTNNNTVGQWVVQVGSYSEVSNAQKMLVQLQQEGLAAYSQPSYLPSGQRIIRVYAGPFSQERALEVKRELHIDGVIMKRNIS